MRVRACLVGGWGERDSLGQSIMFASLRKALASAGQWRATLAQRGVLVVEGRDARKLVQGLVTSDVSLLDSGPQYTAFLAANGRVMFDAFLVGGAEGSVLIDADKACLPSLAKHLLKFKLRSKVKVRDASDEHVVLAVGGGHSEATSSLASSSCLPELLSFASSTAPCEGGPWADPRLACLGARVLHRRDAALPSWLEGAVDADPSLHRLHLSLLGVPEAAATLQDTLPLESNLELLNGVSFAKGCYLGQELTARTHFRGVVRKRLVPVCDASRVGDKFEHGDDFPALAMLPEAERRLASQLLLATADAPAAPTDGGALLGDGPTEEGAGEEEAGEEGGGGGVKLLDGAGKRAATLRSFDPITGIGLALCRLDSLGSSQSLSQVLSAEASARGVPPLLPIRPSWWPQSIGPQPTE